MVSAISRLISDPKETERIAEKGYNMARKRFSVESIVQQVENQIRTVVGDLDVLTYTKTTSPSI